MKNILQFLNSKRFIAIMVVILMSVILWNTYVFSKDLKSEEKVKMEILAEAYNLFNVAHPDDKGILLFLKIVEENKSIPMIVTDNEGNIILNQNIELPKKNPEKVLQKELALMKEANIPITIELSPTNKQYIYYRNSKLLEKLEFYPIALVIIFMLFLTVVYFVFKSGNEAEKNKLWSGMAKETAHQIGTPLSSLLGWIEILKTENVDPDYITEIEKDVKRLNVIADRFSKIGSIPTLKQDNLTETISYTIDYFERRSSKKILFSFTDKFNGEVLTQFNKELIGWVLENLIRNAIDAMQGRGEINLELSSNGTHIVLLVSDTGKGIPRKMQKQIFKPGFTTKSRGWGLGLSLTKRIIEDYHKGKISVKKSKKDLGTTFEILLPLEFEG